MWESYVFAGNDPKQLEQTLWIGTSGFIGCGFEGGWGLRQKGLGMIGFTFSYGMVGIILEFYY